MPVSEFVPLFVLRTVNPLAKALSEYDRAMMPLMAGVVSVGEVAKTSEPPEPVGSVQAVRMFADVKLANAAATFAPNPLTPVLIGKPVHEVSVPLLGVPNAPPLTTNAPALPTLTASAVATPVPSVGMSLVSATVPDASGNAISRLAVGLVKTISTILLVPA